MEGKREHRSFIYIYMSSFLPLFLSIIPKGCYPIVCDVTGTDEGKPQPVCSLFIPAHVHTYGSVMRLMFAHSIFY